MCVCLQFHDQRASKRALLHPLEESSHMRPDCCLICGRGGSVEVAKQGSAHLFVLTTLAFKVRLLHGPHEGRDRLRAHLSGTQFLQLPVYTYTWLSNGETRMERSLRLLEGRAVHPLLGRVDTSKKRTRRHEKPFGRSMPRASELTWSKQRFKARVHFTASCES